MSLKASAAIAFVGIVTLLCTPGAGASECPRSPFRTNRTAIIAHASGDYFGPPNTIEMMAAAVKAGADFIDVDVRVTSDGVLVAAHDDTIAEPGAKGLSIAKTTYARLREIDLGDLWAGPRKDFPLKGKHVRVPTIEQILRRFPHRRIGVEFKTTGGESALCAILRRAAATKDVFVSSAGDAAIDRFKPICPEIETTVTDAMVVEFRTAQARNLPWCAPVRISQPPLSFGATFRLDQANVDWEHAHGLAVYTWTADDLATLKLVAKLGVDGVYTARPDLARKALRG